MSGLGFILQLLRTTKRKIPTFTVKETPKVVLGDVFVPRLDIMKRIREKTKKYLKESTKGQSYNRTENDT